MFFSGKKSIALLAAASLLLTFLLSGCSAVKSLETANTKISKTGFAFDTVIVITLYGTDDESILDGCMELADYYNRLLSATLEGSDIWNINHAEGKDTTVNEETYLLLQTALSYASKSEGAFNPALGTVIDLWDFNSESACVPSDEDLAKALEHIDYNNILLKADNIVQLLDPELKVNLGAIAKGYIADRMKDYLTSMDVSSAIINLGGNVYALGEKPDGSKYTVGIQKPFDDTGSAITSVSISNQSIVTSGTYERYFEQDGVLYHHILDPDTGYPADNGLLSVTILSKESVDGDALSTTCFVLGLDEGLSLIESTSDTEALFITEDYEFHYSSGFPK
ncbi:MAG: FAD:protein FMN transferase [Butyrivibrio sp.]|nr:FAD:protein FMN transferase [Butyrivibrio sp.]